MSFPYPPPEVFVASLGPSIDFKFFLPPFSILEKRNISTFYENHLKKKQSNKNAQTAFPSFSFSSTTAESSDTSTSTSSSSSYPSSPSDIPLPLTPKILSFLSPFISNEDFDLGDVILLEIAEWISFQEKDQQRKGGTENVSSISPSPSPLFHITLPSLLTSCFGGSDDSVSCVPPLLFFLINTFELSLFGKYQRMAERLGAKFCDLMRHEFHIQQIYKRSMEFASSPISSSLPPPSPPPPFPSLPLLYSSLSLLLFIFGVNSFLLAQNISQNPFEVFTENFPLPAQIIFRVITKQNINILNHFVSSCKQSKFPLITSLAQSFDDMHQRGMMVFEFIPCEGDGNHNRYENLYDGTLESLQINRFTTLTPLPNDIHNNNNNINDNGNHHHSDDSFESKQKDRFSSINSLLNQINHHATEHEKSNKPPWHDLPISSPFSSATLSSLPLPSSSSSSSPHPFISPPAPLPSSTDQLTIYFLHLRYMQFQVLQYFSFIGIPYAITALNSISQEEIDLFSSSDAIHPKWKKKLSEKHTKKTPNKKKKRLGDNDEEEEGEGEGLDMDMEMDSDMENEMEMANGQFEEGGEKLKKEKWKGNANGKGKDQPMNINGIPIIYSDKNKKKNSDKREEEDDDDEDDDDDECDGNGTDHFMDDENEHHAIDNGNDVNGKGHEVSAKDGETSTPSQTSQSPTTYRYPPLHERKKRKSRAKEKEKWKPMTQTHSNPNSLPNFHPTNTKTKDKRNNENDIRNENETFDKEKGKDTKSKDAKGKGKTKGNNKGKRKEKKPMGSESESDSDEDVASDSDIDSDTSMTSISLTDDSDDDDPHLHPPHHDIRLQIPLSQKENKNKISHPAAVPPNSTANEKKEKEKTKRKPSKKEENSPFSHANSSSPSPSSSLPFPSIPQSDNFDFEYFDRLQRELLLMKSIITEKEQTNYKGNGGNQNNNNGNPQ